MIFEESVAILTIDSIFAENLVLLTDFYQKSFLLLCCDMVWAKLLKLSLCGSYTALNVLDKFGELSLNLVEEDLTEMVA